jgi:hypothetical protein
LPPRKKPNDAQLRATARRMYAQGYNYKEISKAINVKSMGIIREYVRGVKQGSRLGVCKYCGKIFVKNNDKQQFCGKKHQRYFAEKKDASRARRIAENKKQAKANKAEKAAKKSMRVRKEQEQLEELKKIPDCTQYLPARAI